MKSRTTLVTCTLLVIAAFAVSAALYARLPDPVPTHWGLSGEPDGFTAKPLGAYLLPMVMAAIVALFAVLPAISPRGFRMDDFRGLWNGLTVGITAILLVIHGLTMAGALGHDAFVSMGVPISVGVLFVVLGNYLPKVRRNFFVGIRTPWTLADEEVWASTHRLGGKTFVAGGLVMIAGSLAGHPLVAIGGVAMAALVPVVYSYFASARGGD